MPSVIASYEYDIFISYRQKDNKRDGWVRLADCWGLVKVSRGLLLPGRSI